MKFLLAAVLLPGAAAAAGAQPPESACASYTRASTDAPPEVRSWLSRSADDHVLVCTPAQPRSAGEAATLCSGESGVSRHGPVCSYARHLLSRVGEGSAAHLERAEHGEALAMTLAPAACPAARIAETPDPYTLTYEVPPGAFVAIVSFWAAATASPQALERELSCCRTGPDTSASRLRAAVAAGHHVGAAAVIRIVSLSGRWLQHRYTLLVKDPDAGASGTVVYVVYLRRRLEGLGGGWRISNVSDAPG